MILPIRYFQTGFLVFDRDKNEDIYFEYYINRIYKQCELLNLINF